MKKIILLFLIVMMSFSLFGCKNESQKDFVVNVKFSFYKDGEKKEKFQGNKFKVKTKIFVSVDFDVKKNFSEDEIISFVVQIPYAEYYSTHDFHSGAIQPKKRSYTQNDTKGGQYEVIELSQMNFSISDKEIHRYNYIFEIEARQECELADFIVRFKPENTNLKVTVNGRSNNKEKVSYSFVKGE